MEMCVFGIGMKVVPLVWESCDERRYGFGKLVMGVDECTEKKSVSGKRKKLVHVAPSEWKECFR